MKEIFGGLLAIVLLGGALAELMQLIAKAGIDRTCAEFGVLTAGIMVAIWELKSRGHATD